MAKRAKQLANHPKGWGAPRKGRYPKRKAPDYSKGFSAFGKTVRRAVSKSGRSYAKTGEGKWVQVNAYRRTKPTRKSGPKELAVHACARTRRKKQMGPRRKR